MKNFLLFFLLVSIFVFSRCLSNLSRSSAQETIFENLSNELQTISVQFGRSYTSGRIEGPSKRMNYKGWTENSATSELQIIGKLIDNGIVIRDNGYSWSEKILPFVKTTHGGFYYNIPVAQAIGIEVTGITEIDETRKMVECFVVYEWTEVGKMANLDYILKVPHKFEFKKYDDGWRLD